MSAPKLWVINRSVTALIPLILLWSFPCLSAFCQTATGDAASSEAETRADDAASSEAAAHDSEDRLLTPSDPGYFDLGLSDRIRHFLRVRVDRENKPVAMETSITRYEKTLDDGKRLIVDLVGVVHIGERSYYEQLNKIFEDYDVVLYELVAPEGTRIPKGGRADEGLNPLAAVQNGMKAMLELEFQLDHIDYMKNNLVHADMSPEEFLESMKQNDESFTKMFFKAIGQSLSMQGRSSGMSDADLLMAMMSKNRTVKLRQIMAEQMQDMESGMVIFQGKNGSTIIHHRNEKALSVMDREIEKGHRKLAVFYGAGHLPDMERLLVVDRKMHRAGQYWLQAWNLQKKD